MIKSVVFDWSGVLSDDLAAVFEASNELITNKGGKRLSEKEWREQYELPWMNFYKKLGVEYSEQEGYEAWSKAFPKYSYKIKAFPHAKKILDWLKQKGIKSVVLSSHSTEFLLKELKEYGFEGLISDVEASVGDKRKKIDELVSRNEIERKTSVYVGDMRHDIETAREAEVKSVAVLCGYETREQLETEKPDFIIEDVSELPALIEKLNGEQNG